MRTTAPWAQQLEPLAVPPDGKDNPFDGDVQQKWMFNLSEVINGRQNRQQFINAITASQKWTDRSGRILINDFEGRAVWGDSLKYPYVTPLGGIGAPYRSIANVNALRVEKTNAQVIPPAVATIVVFNNVVFDQSSDYNATNGRFTPTQAGLYLITAVIGFAAAVVAVPQQISCGILKNGVAVSAGTAHTSLVADVLATASTLIQMNGTTDYLEITAFHTFGGPVGIYQLPYATNFTAHKVD